MFTGIVQGLGAITHIEKREKLSTFHVKLPAKARQKALTVGGSIALNGCCLTVTKILLYQEVAFDLIAETLQKTNLKNAQVGDMVNVERAASFSDEIGGHLMSGHIFGTLEISRIIDTANNKSIYFRLPATLKPYIIPKGFVGLDGCSLTIGDAVDEEFCVHLIPETLQTTLFGTKKVGDTVNLEIDPQTQAIVDTVQHILTTKSAD